MEPKYIVTVYSSSNKINDIYDTTVVELSKVKSYEDFINENTFLKDTIKENGYDKDFLKKEYELLMTERKSGNRIFSYEFEGLVIELV